MKGAGCIGAGRSGGARLRVVLAAALAVSGGLIAIAPSALAGPKPKVQTSVSFTPANPILTGQAVTVTVGYSCSGTQVDCTGTTMTVNVPSYLAAPTNLSTSPHLQSAPVWTAATRTITYTFIDPLHAGTSGQVQFTTAFPQGPSPHNQNATISSNITTTNGGAAAASTVVTSAVNNQWYTNLALASGGSINNNATYNAQICVNASQYGQINILSGGALSVTLPAGVTNVTATNGGVYTAATRKVTWSPVGPLSFNTSGACWTPQLTLFYGQPPFNPGQSVNLTVAATVVEPAPNGTTTNVQLAPKTIATTILPASGSFTVAKQCQTSVFVGMQAWCTVTVTNTGNVAIAPSWIDMFPQGFYVLPGKAVAIGNTGGKHVDIYYSVDKAAQPATQRAAVTWYLLASGKVGNGPGSTVNAPGSLPGNATGITGLKYVYTDPFAAGAQTVTTNWMDFTGLWDNGTAIANNTSLSNCATVYWNFNGQKQQGPSCAAIKATQPSPTVSVTKTNANSLYPNTPIVWTVTATNTGNVPETWTAIDILPDGFSIAPGAAIGIGNTQGLSTNIYFASDEAPRNAPVWRLLAGGPFTGAAANASTNAPASLPGGGTKITALKYVFTGAMPMGSAWQVQESTLFSPKYDSGTTIPNGAAMTNCMNVTSVWTSYSAAGSGCSTRNNAPVSDVYTYKQIGAAYPIVNANQQVSFPLYLSNRAGSWYPMTDPVIADVVPAQAAPWNATWAASYSITNAGGLSFTAASDFSVTQMTTAGQPDGRYALRWKFHGSLPPGGVVQLTLRVKALSALPYTDYVDNLWVGAGAMPVYPPTTCSAPANVGGIGLNTDAENVLGLGAAYQACHSKWGFQLSPIAALDSTLLVKGQLDSGWSKWPAQGETVTGGQADYQVQVTNSGTVSMKNAVVVDILPFVGDVSVLSSSPRSSEYAPNLSGPVVPSDPNVKVWYSTKANPCLPELSYSAPGCVAAGWTLSAPFDITTVRSVKFDFSAITIPPQGSISLTWSDRVPNGTPQGLTAWNSIGYTATRVDTNQTLLPAEPFATGIHTNPAVPNFLGDFVWNDNNHNGVQDAGETGINGVPVFLYTSGGVFVDKSITGNNFSGKPGYYSFGSLPDGDYYLQFDLTKLPSYDQVTFQDVGDPANEQIDSDADANGRTPIIHLAGNVTDFGWDMGVWSNICDVVCGAPHRV